MKFLALLSLFGIFTAHVPNILGSFGAGGMQGFFNRNDAVASLKDQPVIAAYEAKKKKEAKSKAKAKKEQVVYPQPYAPYAGGYHPYPVGYPAAYPQ